MDLGRYVQLKLFNILMITYVFFMIASNLLKIFSDFSNGEYYSQYYECNPCKYLNKYKHSIFVSLMYFLRFLPTFRKFTPIFPMANTILNTVNTTHSLLYFLYLSLCPLQPLHNQPYKQRSSSAYAIKPFPLPLHTPTHRTPHLPWKCTKYEPYFRLYGSSY